VNNHRKYSLAAGILYVITFVSIPTLALYGPVHGPSYITGPGPDTQVILGGILEIIVALAGIGTAVALYPVVKRQNEGVALGFVGARTLEAATIFTGVASLFAVVTLRKVGVGSDAVVTGQALVALYDGLFLVGQSLIPAVNGLLLGYLMYKSGLVPRVLPVVGFIGAVVLIAATTSRMFGIVLPASLFVITTLPIALWEFSLGVWLVAKGFNKSAITSLSEKTTRNELLI
jgi:hypothetical protein